MSRCGKLKNKTRAVFEGIWNIAAMFMPQVMVVKDETGQLLTDLEAIKTRWQKYFDSLYSDPNETDEAYLQTLDQAPNSNAIPAIGAIRNLKTEKAQSSILTILRQRKLRQQHKELV